jgi:hypothetical protein
MPNLIEIRSVVPEMEDTDGQTEAQSDRHDLPIMR